MLLQELGVGLSTYFFDHEAEQHVADVVVRGASSGREDEGLIGNGADDLVRCALALAVAFCAVDAYAIGDAGGVLQELAEGDVLPRSGCFGIVLHELVGRVKEGLLLAKKNGGCGELLGLGTDGEASGRGAGNVPLDIREAIAFVAG